MNKILKNTTDSFREKGSKFIGHLFSVDSKNEFEIALDNIKSKYPDATHHCYGWRLNPPDPREFAQDDGEPSGTAGLPILNRLKSFELINAAIIVVRYYGGTNLGKSGLIEAYGRSAENCIAKANIKPITLIQKVKVSYPYSEQNAIEQLIHRFDLHELSSSYQEKVTIVFGCPVNHFKSLKDRLDDLTHLEIEAESLDKTHI